MIFIKPLYFQKTEFETTLDFHIQYHDQHVIQRNLIQPSMLKKAKEMMTSNIEPGHPMWNDKLGNVFQTIISISAKARMEPFNREFLCLRILNY